MIACPEPIPLGRGMGKGYIPGFVLGCVFVRIIKCGWVPCSRSHLPDQIRAFVLLTLVTQVRIFVDRTCQVAKITGKSMSPLLVAGPGNVHHLIS